MKEREARPIDSAAELRVLREYVNNNVATWEFDQYYVDASSE
jgi:L-amino acid N-acyltransferase YncA